MQENYCDIFPYSILNVLSSDKTTLNFLNDILCVAVILIMFCEIFFVCFRF